MKLTLLSLLFPFLIFSQTQIGQDIYGEAAEDQLGWGLSLSSDGTIVAIGADGNDGNGDDFGHVRIFENVNNVWTQIGQDIEGEFSQNYFGYELSLSSDGSIVAIGSFAYNTYGKVRIFENVNNVWTQIGQDIVSENYNDDFGESVSLSSNGNVVVIGGKGAIYNGESLGHVLVFENINNVWTQKGQTLVGDGAYHDFGSTTSISSDGSIIAVSAPGGGLNSSELEYIKVYEFLNNSWNQLGNTLYGSNLNIHFGNSLALSSNGNIVATGAIGTDVSFRNTGQVRVFSNINNVWTQIGNEINGESIDDSFGGAVSLSSDGSILGIGSPNTDVNGINSGQAKVYKNMNNTWTQIGNNIDGDVTYDKLGGSVSLSSNGSIIAIGAPWSSANSTFAGQVKIYDLNAILSSDKFVLSQFSLYPNPANNYLYLKANNPIESIEIYNIIGQQILSNTPNTLTEDIDMSGFNSGMYLVKVTIGEQTATYKVVKE